MSDEAPFKAERIIVNVSGGKDSTATLALACEERDRTGIPVLPIFADTYFEHPAVYEYLDYLDRTLNVKIEHVGSKIYKSMDDLIRARGIFPSHARRFCTDELKQRPIKRFLTTLEKIPTEQWLGMRSDESTQRNKMYGGLKNDDLFIPSEVSKRNWPTGFDKWMRLRLPIVEWDVVDVWAYLKKRGLERNRLYNEGRERVGCFPCLLSGVGDLVHAMRDPVGKANMDRMFALEDELNVKRLANPPKRTAEGESARPIKIKPKHDRFDLQKLHEADKCGQLAELIGDDADGGPGCGYCAI